ncbi:hypothetical protein RBA41_03305 [Massilia sp. CCM 9210]|uniref:hypothetical protein n=1 Tax=Massilia scottii TaxID=3057166 RepID=UPI002796A09A|nr:hypothetical protein [Massilia sp. CCM 9210]MDQ1812322.1 hypothetical protein [Massilia sp. CCM 9210]
MKNLTTLPWLSVLLLGSASALAAPTWDSYVKESCQGNGTRQWSANGLAHIGMLPDFIADLRTQGLRQPDLAPLMNSAESDIRMWEQAVAKSTSVP